MAITTNHVLALVVSTIAALTSAAPAPEAATAIASVSTSVSATASTSTSASASVSVNDAATAEYLPPSPALVVLSAILPNSSINGHPITASASNFSVSIANDPPTIYCPATTPTPGAPGAPSIPSGSNPSGSSSTANITCPPETNSTVFNLPPPKPGFSLSHLSLSVDVPGGQALYVRPDDSLAFDLPHTGSPAPRNASLTHLPVFVHSDGTISVVGRKWCLNETATAGTYEVFLPKEKAAKEGCLAFKVQSHVWTGGVGAFAYI